MCYLTVFVLIILFSTKIIVYIRLYYTVSEQVLMHLFVFFYSLPQHPTTSIHPNLPPLPPIHPLPQPPPHPPPTSKAPTTYIHTAVECQTRLHAGGTPWSPRPPASGPPRTSSWRSSPPCDRPPPRSGPPSGPWLRASTAPLFLKAEGEQLVRLVSYF